MLPSIFGENLFDDFFSAPFSRALTGTRDPFWGKGTQNLMRTDVKETEAGYELDIDLPGFNKEDMNLELDNGYLTITAKKSSSTEDKKEGRYIRQERFSGQCSRCFYVGDVRPEEINAKYDSGILQLTIPKKDVKQLPQQNRIAIQ